MTDYLGPYELNTIITGDARELAKAIPDESVDLILCDPVWWQIDDYAWLADLAARTLIKGGNVIAQVGSEYRYDAETAMRMAGLSSLPLLAQVYDMAFRRVFNPKVMQGWKPHLWLCKSTPDKRIGGWLFDRFHSHGFPSKNGHVWADNPAFYEVLVQNLTDDNGVVLDPFTGGGTVPAVCKILRRNYIAFEIDPTTADLARERVANTQPPLPLEYHEQLDLLPPGNHV